jgi:hypothetical protein
VTPAAGIGVLDSRKLVVQCKRVRVEHERVRIGRGIEAALQHAMHERAEQPIRGRHESFGAVIPTAFADRSDRRSDAGAVHRDRAEIACRLRRRRIATPIAPNPSSIIAQVDGSGTAAAKGENWKSVRCVVSLKRK